MTELLAVDPYKKKAYSTDVSFDLEAGDLTVPMGATDVPTKGEDYNPEISHKKTLSKDWELDVRPLISTKKWLQNYGLKKNKLTLYQLLPTIGFKHSDDFDWTLRRPVSSRYAEGAFSQLFRPDGKTFNITCGRDRLRQVESRLLQAGHLFRRRMEWLTTESRRLFGVIEEKAITIVLDIRNMSPQQFDLYRMALERVLFEQVTQLAKFNLIRACDNMKVYQEECVPVTHDTLEGALTWLWGLDRLAELSKSACCEAVLKAAQDRNNEAVYLFTEGTSVDSCRELLKEKILELDCKLPVHIVSYNCDSSDTVRFLRELVSVTNARFHVYAVIMEMDSYEGLPVDQKSNKANIVLKRKTYGGVPPGAGMRADVIHLFEEMEEARNTLAQIQALIEAAPEPKVVLESQLSVGADPASRNEEYMSSKQWLGKYGLQARKLELYDVLGGVAFKHSDGVVDLREAPQKEGQQTDAVSTRKLVNAKYCDRFPVVKWKDGKVVHVQVTPEIHRLYEQRMMVALRAIQQRIDWLNQGSRALFGTLVEEQIYILIDTSESMVPSIQYVKDKLFLLMQEQLRHKMKFNLVAFNSKSIVWQNRLVEVTETSLEGAWRWIQGLSCWGSTNTYSALQHALADPGTHAIYLLTDGRPDQPPKSVIAQVQMQHSVPVHTISFNCNDTEANQFLFDLAQATGGRYHHFSQKGHDPDSQPESWESEDITLLKDELRKGLENLDRVAELRDECAKLSWRKEIDLLKKCSKNHPMPQTDRVSAVRPTDPSHLYRPATPPPRPQSAPPTPELDPTPPRPSSATFQRSLPSRRRSAKMLPQLSASDDRPFSASKSERPSTAKMVQHKPLVAGHTRTSLLRTLNTSGKFSPEEWLLPETRLLFERQAERQKKLAIVEERSQRHERTRSERRRLGVKRVKTGSTKHWLARHGLVAMKLTLLDALAPTVVKHKSRYVPIIDRHVLAKVFDEVLPIAYVSNKPRKPLKLINPNGVDLEGYQLRVEKALQQYRERLDNMVWAGLPLSVREEEYDNNGPVSFSGHRTRLLELLEEAGWPVSREDVLLLEEEISKGERFVQQAQDLCKAANPKILDEGEEDDLTVYDDKASVESGLNLSARSNNSVRSDDMSNKSQVSDPQ